MAEQSFINSSSKTDFRRFRQKGIQKFLYQFHPGATVDLRYQTAERGPFACLRAISEQYAEIVFRIHTEFEINAEARARFMPAQFRGRLILDRNSGTVREFSLTLPPRNTNVDINAFNAADMVFVPQMELIGRDMNVSGEIVWEKAITEDEARRALELKFYLKFAKTQWTPISEVIATENMLVLW